MPGKSDRLWRMNFRHTSETVNHDHDAIMQHSFNKKTRYMKLASFFLLAGVTGLVSYKSNRVD